MSAPPLFSESWHLVAGLRVALRRGLAMRRQSFRGELWYLVGDHYNNRFYRFRRGAYLFIARLDGRQTVEECWNRCLALDPNNTPSQTEVISILAQLHQANLLISDLSPDSTQLFNRQRQQVGKKIRGQIANILFLRIPLWDPDRFLNRCRWLIRACFSPLGGILWLIWAIVCLSAAAGHWQELLDKSQGVLAPGNLFLLYTAWGIIKFLHEMGHAAATKRFDGEVHSMGVAFLVFNPVPFVDASAAWAFRQRAPRLLVGAAGMMTELVFAGLALLIWVNTSPGLVNQIAFNIIFLASVSTILFNINPLLRFDGYYILSDLLEAPNLQNRSFNQIRTFAERRLFGLRHLPPETEHRREAFWLTVYGLASVVYRMWILTAIILFIADQLLGLGLLLAAFAIAVWIIFPVWKFFSYLFTEPRLDRHRPRALAVALGALGALLLFLALVPFPHHFRATGVVRGCANWYIIPETDGILKTIVARHGWLRAGQTIAELENPILALQIQQEQSTLAEMQARRAAAREQSPVFIQALDSLIAASQERLHLLHYRQAALVLKSPGDGEWFSPSLADFQGAWLARGTPLGQVVDTRTFFFSAIVEQNQAARLFSTGIRRAEVRLKGEAGFSLPGSSWEAIPADQRRLPTPALGYSAGGSIAVSSEDRGGSQTIEPFFEVRVILPPARFVHPFHLRSGAVRFTLEPQPLLLQWWHRLRQLLQKRYQF